MALVAPYELDGVTVGTSELSVVSGTTTLQSVTTDGIYHLWLDASAMAKGDVFRWRAYEKVEDTGGTKRCVMTGVIRNAQTSVLVTPPLMLLYGWDFTLQKIAGTDRAFDAEIRGSTGAALSQHSELDGVTIGTTEWSLTTNSAGPDLDTTAGIYQVFVDPLVAPMAKADEFELAVYEKVEATGGTQRVVFTQRIVDVQSCNLVTPMLHLRNGWDATLKKIAGTDRAMDASVRKVA